MLSHMRKRKRMDKYWFQDIRDIVKEGGEDVVEKLKKKLKETRRMFLPSCTPNPIVIIFLSLSIQRINWKLYMWEHRVKQESGSKGMDNIREGNPLINAKDLHLEIPALENMFPDSQGLTIINLKIMDDAINHARHHHRHLWRNDRRNRQTVIAAKAVNRS